MSRLLGENYLPSSLQRRRRRLRERVLDVRDPIRQRRESHVPGPDLIGTAEMKADELRDKVVSRDSALSGIKDRMENGDSETVEETDEEADNGGNGDRGSSAEQHNVV